MITDKPIQPEEHVIDLDPSCGAVATFQGVIRDRNGDRRVTGIFYDCYREMAEREIAAIVREIKEKIAVDTIRIVHRVGEVAAGDVSLFVVVAAAHRAAAFDACRATVDALKRRLPIWKKERYADQTANWL